MAPYIVASLVVASNIAAILALVKLTGGRAAFRSSVLCIGFIVGSFIPLMGIPGALALLPAELWSHLIFDVSVMTEFDGDRAWPAALFVTALIDSALIPILAISSWKTAAYTSKAKKRWFFWGLLTFWASWCPVILLWLERIGAV